MKWELEDARLRYLDPQAYHDIAERVAKKRAEREAEVQHVIDELREQFEAIGLQCRDQRPPQALLLDPQEDAEGPRLLDDLRFDGGPHHRRFGQGLLRLRWASVHSIWKPLPGRFKDYIAMPKPNMYQSLHTTVVGPGGDPLEVQIRTLEMHRTSEYGIAAHWRYKEGAKGDTFEQKLTWLRSLLEWQNDMRDSRMFMENLKLDLFESQVFIFSPQGRRVLAAGQRHAARFRLSGALRAWATIASARR